MQLVELVDAAAAGTLPDWAEAGPARLQHMQRVAALMSDWARALDLPAAEQTRWAAAGMLHDVLRDADPVELRPLVPAHLRDLPPKLLHGPAAAVRLREHGVADDALLHAITFHPIGHPDFDELGRSLFIADHIEPGRTYDPNGLAALRARMPLARDAVLRDVLGRRLRHLLDQARPLRAETTAFWNALTGARETAATA